MLEFNFSAESQQIRLVLESMLDVANKSADASMHVVIDRDSLWATGCMLIPKVFVIFSSSCAGTLLPLGGGLSWASAGSSHL